MAALLAALLTGAVMPSGAPAREAADGSFPWPPLPWATARLEDGGAEAGEEPERASPLPTVRRGPASSGAVALTFDDGYNSRACSFIADELRKHDAVGTFFINGRWLQRDPAKWRAILEGMEVANHTRSHPVLTRVPHPVVINQIRSNEYIHERVLGRPMLKVLRPPYGAHSERIDRIAAQLGYEYIVMWNVDTRDWRPKARARSIVRRAIDAPPGSIILMHCAHGATVKAVPLIIRHYQRRGIELAGLARVLEDAQPTPDDDRTEEGYGRP